MCPLAWTVAAQTAIAPIPDADLGAMLAPWVFDSLRGGGMRADTHWIAADSLTYRALGVRAGNRGIHLEGPRDSLPTCPGSSNATNSALAVSTGYRIEVSFHVDVVGHLIASGRVGCRFIYSGAPPGPRSGFSEGVALELVKESGGWRVVKVIDRWIT